MQMAPTGGRARTRERVVRLLCLGLAVASAAALFLATPGNARASDADSPLTVSWAGDTGAASADQPKRDASDVHYASLKNISVTVDQTTGVGDQAVGVHVSGFAATRQATDYTGTPYTDAMNFMQAMECWGTDPNSATFNQTCEWGGRYGPNNGIGSTVYSDNLLRVPAVDMAPPATGTRPSPDPLDVPFLPYGTTTAVTGHQNAGATADSPPLYPLFDLFGVSTTNEIQSVRMDSSGAGSFDFETQNSDDAPAMGCGIAGHTRCWLVLVPRDTIYGGHDSSCSQILDNSFEPYTYGRADSIQAGSPVNPNCDYWNNRIVVPLDFTPTGSNCASSVTSRGIVGSEMMVGAMASWQPELCADLKTTYSFDSNPDTVARAQLVEGQSGAGMVFGSAPESASELNEDDQSILSQTQLSYAPVAVTSAVFGFLAEGTDGRITTLNLSPRLVAKLLTQSYEFTVPSNSADPQANFAHLPATNRKYVLWSQDPDFQALNPDWKQFTTNPAIILPGPQGADVIKQLWKWIDADPAAAAWLAGGDDGWGMTINPYYLPKGDPGARVPTFNADGTPALDSSGAVITAAVGLSNLDGSPMKIGVVAQNSFIKADASLVPLNLNPPGQVPVRYPFGSNQFAPYAATFALAARSTFRADPGSQTVWDPNQIDPAGDKGAWISGGPQIPGQRFTISFTDAASAQRFDLSTASLTPDGSPTTPVAPTDAAVTQALSTALAASTDPGVQQINPAKAAAGAYPLTTVVYATVNLTASDAAARTDFANFLNEVTTKGQTPGVQVGQLPPGYVPLTPTLAGQAAAAATAIQAFVPGQGTSPDGSNTLATTGSSGADGTGAAAGAAGSGAITTTDATSGTKTPASPAPGGQSGLLITLITGVAGSLFAPALFRRRRIT
jgi:hypothetical protein